jgi:hypothetical protein
MFGRLMLAPTALIALLATSCGTGTSTGHVGSPTEGSKAPIPMRPTAIDDSIALLPGGKSLRAMDLSNVYLPAGGRIGTVVEIHPTAQPLMVQVSKLPSGGNLLVCPVNVAGFKGSWSRNKQPCVPVTVATGTSVKLDAADGTTHAAMEFSGTWKVPVTLKSIGVSYTAVDDHFYVDFAIP